MADTDTTCVQVDNIPWNKIPKGFISLSKPDSLSYMSLKSLYSALRIDRSYLSKDTSELKSTSTIEYKLCKNPNLDKEFLETLLENKLSIYVNIKLMSRFIPVELALATPMLDWDWNMLLSRCPREHIETILQLAATDQYLAFNPNIDRELIDSSVRLRMLHLVTLLRNPAAIDWIIDNHLDLTVSALILCYNPALPVSSITNRLSEYSDPDIAAILFTCNRYLDELINIPELNIRNSYSIKQLTEKIERDPKKNRYLLDCLSGIPVSYYCKYASDEQLSKANIIDRFAIISNKYVSIEYKCDILKSIHLSSNQNEYLNMDMTYIPLEIIEEYINLPWDWKTILNSIFVTRSFLSKYGDRHLEAVDRFADTYVVINNSVIDGNRKQIKDEINSEIISKGNLLCYDPYMISEPYKKYLVKRFIDICGDELMAAACHPDRLAQCHEDLFMDIMLYNRTYM